MYVVKKQVSNRKSGPEIRVTLSTSGCRNVGPCPKRWTKTGVIVEVLPNRQYQVKVHGSNFVTLRNRRFNKKINPVADTSCRLRYAEGQRETLYQESLNKKQFRSESLPKSPGIISYPKELSIPINRQPEPAALEVVPIEPAQPASPTVHQQDPEPPVLFYLFIYNPQNNFT